MRQKEWSTFADGPDCRECASYEKENSKLKKDIHNLIQERGSQYQELAKLKQQLDVLRGAVKEISMYGISEPNTQAKIAIEALKEIGEIKRWLISAHDWNEDEHELGDWVKFDDHEIEIKRLEAELDELKKHLEQVLETNRGQIKLNNESWDREMKLKRANEIMKTALEVIGRGESQFDNVDHMHTARKALSEIEGMK